MNKNEEDWLYAAFDIILEEGNLEKIGCFLEKNPIIVTLYEKIADENEIGGTDIMEYIKKREKPPVKAAERTVSNEC